MSIHIENNHVRIQSKSGKEITMTRRQYDTVRAREALRGKVDRDPHYVHSEDDVRTLREHAVLPAKWHEIARELGSK